MTPWAFLSFVVSGKMRRDGKKYRTKTCGRQIGEPWLQTNASNWMTSPLCWVRAPSLLWERFLAIVVMWDFWSLHISGVSTLDESQEEEEIGNSEGVAKQVGSRGCQTSQGNGCLTASDRGSPDRHSTHWLIHLEKQQEHCISQTFREMRMISPEANPHAPSGLQTTASTSSQWGRIANKKQQHQPLAHSVQRCFQALTPSSHVEERAYSMKKDKTIRDRMPRGVASAKQEGEWLLIL